jgi:hypothetical protein
MHQLNLKFEFITPSHEYVEPCEPHKHYMATKKRSSNYYHVHNLISFRSVNCRHHLLLSSHPYANVIPSI